MRATARPAQLVAALLIAAAASGCASRADRPTAPTRERFTQRGEASWYGPQFHGRATASGERFDMNRPSAAHRTLPFGTVVRVRNLDNGTEIDVRINDRGPFVRGRILDLSRAAAEGLGMIAAGIAEVRLWVISWPDEQVARASIRARAGGNPARTGAPSTGTSAPPPAGRRATTLQAGAFRELERARRLAEDIRRFDRRAQVYSDDGWHRVQIRGLSAEQAASLRAELAARGIDTVLLDR